MGEIIAKLNILAKEGYLYYVKRDPDGYLLVGEAKLQRNGRTKKQSKDVV